MKRDVYSMKRDVYSMKRDVYSMKRDVYSMKRDVYSMKRDVHSMKRGLQSRGATRIVCVRQAWHLICADVTSKEAYIASKEPYSAEV